MKAFDQGIFIDQLEAELENQLQEVIQVYQNLDQSVLLRPSATGGWSIAECFEHLNSYAHYYHPKIVKALQRPPAVSDNSVFKHSWIGSRFIRIMDVQTSKRKFKAIKRHLPQKQLDGYAVMAEFIQHEEDLLKYIQQARLLELRKIHVTTSLSSLIKINLGDLFQFLLVHSRRHLVQARRNC